MKIIIQSENDLEKKSFGDKAEIIHEGVTTVVIAGQNPSGSITFAHGNHFDVSGQLHRVQLQLDTQFATNLEVDREVRKLQVIGQLQHEAAINAQVIQQANGRANNLKLRN